MTRRNHPVLPGEIPKGQAEFVVSLCVYARQRTLEPVLELMGVTEKSVSRGLCPPGSD